MKAIVKISDDEFKDFVKKLELNDFYCPCKIDRNKDTKCLCLDFRTTGICECGVYKYNEESK